MVFEKVCSIISDQFGISEDELSPETDLVNDLGADTLDMADLAMSFEDEFQIEFTEEAVNGFKTVGDIVDYINLD